MSGYQLYMRLKHLFMARHFRGHGIHSPYLYDFVRNILIRSDIRHISEALACHYPSRRIVDVWSVVEIPTDAYIVVLWGPFRCSADRAEWASWRSSNACLSVWLKRCIVIFFDTRLNDQHFAIRS